MGSCSFAGQNLGLSFFCAVVGFIVRKGVSFKEVEIIGFLTGRSLEC